LACQWSGSAPTPAPASTLAPYEEYTIEALRGRTYGGGDIEVVEILEETDVFTRYLIRYPSDGLSIYGFANVPKGSGPFPVIVAVHGFVEPTDYETLDYTTPALDRFTHGGYIAIHPDMRGYGRSDHGENRFRVGMTIDILNLIALVKAEAGPPDLFASAASESIGLWGHSMGGSIALRALTVSSDVRAAVLIASMGGDELKNAELLFKISGDPDFQSELAVPPAIAERISPGHFYKDISAPIQLHHGAMDQLIPVTWAEETCKAASEAGVEIECIYYAEEDHTFRGRVAEQFYGSMSDFYEMHLSP
jgi:dipeptidyl aminopeptidase/acylaminoacyl peptidase